MATNLKTGKDQIEKRGSDTIYRIAQDQTNLREGVNGRENQKPKNLLQN
jgi:hypothetical protein